MSRPSPIDGSNTGYVRLHRKLLDNPLFRDKPEGWFKIWIYILLRANWKESLFRPRQGDPLSVPAGSLVTSLEKLGTHAGLSKEHARRCLDYLEKAHVVTLQTTHQWTMINVTNWTTYQQSEEGAQHAGEHTSQHAKSDSATHGATQQTTHAATLSKEEKNLDKKYTSNSGELDSVSGDSLPNAKPSRRARSVDPVIRGWFEIEFWPLYPRKEGKQPALEAACKSATTPEKRAYYVSRLKSQLPGYEHRKRQSGQRVIPMAVISVF